LIEQRRDLVNDKMRFANRLCSTRKQYYPQALDWFEQRDTLLFCDFLTRWPTLLSAKRARKTTLEALFYAHHGRRATLIEARLASIRAASALTEDAGIIEPCRLHVLSLVEQLRTVLTVIDRFDKKSSGSLLHYRTAHCFGTYQAQVSIWRHACSLPSGSIVSASMARTGCKSTPALPR
jgi:hypothetical protein